MVKNDFQKVGNLKYVVQQFEIEFTLPILSFQRLLKRD